MFFHQRQPRVVGQKLRELSAAHRHRLHVRQCTSKVVVHAAHPARQAGVSTGQLAFALQKAVFDLGYGSPGSKAIRLRTAPGTVGAVSGLNLQLGLVALADQQRTQALLVIAIEPRLRGVALQIGQGHGAAGDGGFSLSLKAVGARAALVSTGEFLHHADRPHGHKVAGQVELVFTVDGQVIDA